MSFVQMKVFCVTMKLKFTHMKMVSFHEIDLHSNENVLIQYEIDLHPNEIVFHNYEIGLETCPCEMTPRNFKLSHVSIFDQFCTVFESFKK